MYITITSGHRRDKGGCQHFERADLPHYLVVVFSYIQNTYLWMNYTALRIRSTAAAKSCCTIDTSTAELKWCYQFLQIIHTHLQNDTLHTTTLELLLVFHHYVSLHFTVLYLTQTGAEQQGMEWPGWESEHPQRVVKLMEEVPDWKSFCVQVCWSRHITLCPDISSLSVCLGTKRVSFSHLSLLYFSRLPQYFPTPFTQQSHVYHITHHQAIWSKL